MSATKLQWPDGATHARQSVDGVTTIVTKRNADILGDGKVEFGLWKDRCFIVATNPPKLTVPVPSPVVVIQATGRGGVPASWGGRRRFIAELIIAGNLTAREIADKVMAAFPGETTLEKALAHVRATPQHLKVATGVKYSYRKESSRGEPVVVPAEGGQP